MPDYYYPNYAPWYSQRDKIKKVVIKDEVTSIGEYAFYRCSGLTSITIPNSVKSIRNNVFYRCSGLTSITIPNSVTSIGDAAFKDCSGLTSLTIPNSVTSIGESAFHGCSGLTSLTIPNSVTSIGLCAFQDCYGVTSITCEANTPPDCQYFGFGDVIKNIPVYVPTNSVEAYKKADVWKDFSNIRAIPSIYTLTDGELYNVGS